MLPDIQMCSVPNQIIFCNHIVSPKIVAYRAKKYRFQSDNLTILP
jgi:hypothetical protein